MLIAPTNKPFNYQQPPRLSLGLAALLLILFAWLQPIDSQRQASLTTFYQQHLLAVEWPLYPTHLLQHQQTTVLDDLKTAYNHKDYAPLAQQLGFDREFSRTLSSSGQDFLEPDVFSQWQEHRKHFDQERDHLSSQVLGLDEQRFRPITFFTYTFIDHNSLNVLATVILLLLVGMCVEWALGSGALLSTWLIGGLVTGIIYCVINGHSVTPLVGSTGAISGVLGLAFMNFRHAQSLTFGQSNIRLNGWLFLALFIVLAAINVLTGTINSPFLIALSASFISGMMVCLVYHRWFQQTQHAEAEPSIASEEMPADELYRHELHHALVKISQMQFVAAEKQLRELSLKYPQDRRILEHLYHLLKSKPSELEFEEISCGLFSLPHQVSANHLVLTIYNDYKRRSKTFVALDADTCLQLAMRFSRIDALKEAEEVFKRSLDAKQPSPLLRKAALVLHKAFTDKGQEQRAQFYQKMAS